MPTSDASWSGRLRIIGDLERPDHWHLQADDDAAFFGEYTPREGWRYSSTNQLILNLKKRPSVARGTFQWPHKLQAIRDIAAAIRANLTPDALATSLFAPIPSSKTPAHPDFDPRMLQVAQSIGAPARAADVLRTTADRLAMHESADRRDPDALAATIEVIPAAIPAGIQRIFLLDDMITTGCSFRVCKRLLEPYVPGVPIIGLFASRRVLPDPLAAFDDLEF
jgi:hypothetical protein